MKESELRAALGKRLETMEDAPQIIGANKPILAELPAMLVEFIPSERKALTLGSWGTSAPGVMQVTVLSELDRYEVEGIRIADAIAALFPKSLRLTEGSTQVEITSPTSILRGYPDGSRWRIPVQVKYMAVSA